MKSETLVHQHPPTPPNILSEHSALHQIASFNAGRHYSYDDGQSHGLRYDSAGIGINGGHPESVFQSGHGHVDGYGGSDFDLGLPMVSDHLRKEHITYAHDS